MPYHTHQVIELPEIQMAVMHVVLHEGHCPGCGRLLKAELPAKYRYGYGPRLGSRSSSGSCRESAAGRSAVQEFCTSVLGAFISRGAIHAWWIGSQKITPHYEAIAGKA